MAGVLVVGEISAKGELRHVSLEVVEAGKSIASALGGGLTALVIGSGIASEAAKLNVAGVDKILVVDDPRLASPSAEAATTAVVAAVKATGATVVLMPGTTAGRDYAPRAAARLGVGLAADSIAVAVDGGSLVATRTVLGGRAQSEVRMPGSPTQMATIRPGAFAKADGTGTASTESLAVDFGPEDFRVTVTGIASKGGGATNLDAAPVVVAGGRGLKEPANFKLVEDLAQAFGGAVGATRAVVDAGWREHHEQIGQTGRTVSPGLYIAVGVSGAVQHNVGMQGSGAIVAINRDPDAPIFKIAQFGIVGDLFEVVPALTAQVRAARG